MRKIITIIRGLTLALMASLFLSSLALNCSDDYGSVTIQVLGAFEQPVVGARVFSGEFEGVTESGGYLYSDRVPAGSYMVKVEANGFAPTYHKIQVTTGQSTLSVFHLLPVTLRYSSDLSRENIVKSKNVEVQIPPGAIEGNLSGRIELGVITPGNSDLRAMPGEFIGNDINGNSEILETFGAISLRILDQKRRELKINKPLKVRFPYNGNETTVPLWSFDPETGAWKEEGVAQVDPGGKFAVAKIEHLSWWNLDRPISEKTSIWVKSFVDENNEFLFTPLINGVGEDYNGVSYPYSNSKNQQNNAPLLAGSCIDVKLGSNIILNAGFYSEKGSFELSQKLKAPNVSSSCQVNPADGLVIEKLELKSVPTTCVRGKVTFTNADLKKFDIEAYPAPVRRMQERDGDPGSGDSPVGSAFSLWSRSISLSKTRSNSDGEFCLEHLPQNRSFTLVFRNKKNLLDVEDRSECDNPGVHAMLEVKSSESKGKRCLTDFSECTDLGEIKGTLGIGCY